MSPVLQPLANKIKAYRPSPWPTCKVHMHHTASPFWAAVSVVVLQSEHTLTFLHYISCQEAQDWAKGALISGRVATRPHARYMWATLDILYIQRPARWEWVTEKLKRKRLKSNHIAVRNTNWTLKQVLSNKKQQKNCLLSNKNWLRNNYTITRNSHCQQETKQMSRLTTTNKKTITRNKKQHQQETSTEQQ